MSLGVGSRRCSRWTPRRADRRRHRRGQGTAGHVDDDGVTFTSHLDGRPPVHPRGVDRHPASTRCRHHLRVRRTDHSGEYPWLPGDFGAAHPRLGGALPGRAPAALRCGPDQPYQALFGVVQGAQYEDLRRRPPAELVSLVDDDGRGLRRLRHRRSAGEAEPRHHRPLGVPATSRRQAAASARHQRARRPVHGRRERRRHVRLRFAVPGGPQRGDVFGDRPVQPHRAGSGATSPRSTPTATATPAPTTPAPTCTTSSRPRNAGPTLCTIHNERFIVRLVDGSGIDRGPPISTNWRRCAGPLLLLERCKHYSEPISSISPAQPLAGLDGTLHVGTFQDVRSRSTPSGSHRSGPTA